MKAVCVALFAGMAACAFGILAAQAQEQVLYSFCKLSNCTDGRNPVSSLTYVNGSLYGTTSVGGAYCYNIHCGVGFALSLSTDALTLLHNFGQDTDGRYPHSNLLDVKGTLYGTTYNGGTSGGGVVFSINPKIAQEKVLYDFCSQTNCADGLVPSGNLIDISGTLYGATQGGGSASQGTVFAVDPKTGAETVVYSFCTQANCTDGADPVAGLIDAGGTLYGTTYAGGTNGWGTVFALDPNNGTETVLHSFGSGADGQLPVGGLLDVKGTLYGTTLAGGAYGAGTVFALDLNTGIETVLYSFCGQSNCTDGAYPESGLIDVKGTLYGTTYNGGANAGGTVFAIDPKTGAENVAYSFCSQTNCADGSGPVGGLIAVMGTLYGSTADGGANCASRCGTVFALKP